MIYLILILCALGIGSYFYLKHCKRLKLPNVYLVTGAVKTGKTCFSVGLVVKQYKKNLRNWYIAYPFRKLIDLFRSFMSKRSGVVYPSCIPLKPMLYSNIPLAKVKYNLFTKEILYRQVRIPNKAVVLLDEVSL